MHPVTLAALVLLAGCSKREEAKPAPAPGSAAGVEDVVPAEVEAIAPAKPTVGKPVAREAAMPPRTACATTCKQPDGDCHRVEGTIFVEGDWNNHIGCYHRAVQIDCCAALPVDDVSGIATALGWKAATTEQRVAIAWFIARVVKGRSILTEVPEPFGAVPAFTQPTVSSQQPVVLDFWWWPHNVRSLVLVHEKLRFNEDGVPIAEPVREVEAEEKPPLDRERALEEARKAGLLEPVPN